MASEISDPGFPYTEEREDILRLCLPSESLGEGLYIHPLSVRLLATRTHGVESEEPVQVWVDALDFMEVQKERDEYRRTLALINSTRVGPIDDGARLRRTYDLCQAAGFGLPEARAINGLLEQAARED